MPKRLLEAATPQARAKQRRTLGTLRELTVQPSTRARYNKAIDHFLSFLKSNGLQLPHQRALLDPLVCEYLEHLWSSGAGRAQGSDCLAGLQDFDPKVKGQIPCAWRLMKTWVANETPNRAPPLPEHVLVSMCGCACFNQHYGFAISLVAGFYGMLRTGEILGLRRKDFALDQHHRKVLLSLGMTKTGKRLGASESVVFGFDKVVRVLQRWMSMTKPLDTLTPSPAKWRCLFNTCLQGIGIESVGFRPYSLRRGGATWWFAKHHSLDKLLIDGRWQAAKTARIYINEGLSVLTQINLPKNDPRLRPYWCIGDAFLTKPTFATLEPPLNSGRSGGRGRHKPKRSGKRFWQNFFPLRDLLFTLNWG